jgi:hypothetical protein
MKISQLSLLAGLCLLSACKPPAAEAQGGAGTIEAINHTRWAINQFSVDGQSGIDAIGPYDGGGGGCCYGVPGQWKPGMTVRVDWETGEFSTKDFPGFADYKKYKVWEKKMSAYTRQHNKLVSVPDYTGQKTCGITVHFMPCDEVRVTTSCMTYNNPNYPIKEPLRMPEPKVCPQ